MPILHKSGARLIDVALSDVRHSDQRCYIEEGHGGTKIEEWPIYKFYSLYINNNPDEARSALAQWYKRQYDRYSTVPKSEGGMRGGSLDRSIRALERENPGEQDPTQTRTVDKFLDQAVERCVDRRFALLESIQQHGYIPDQTDPVVAIRRGRWVMLQTGHHRAAALKSLGWSSMPDILECHDEKAYRIWKLKRKVLHILRIQRAKTSKDRQEITTA